MSTTLGVVPRRGTKSIWAALLLLVLAILLGALGGLLVMQVRNPVWVAGVAIAVAVVIATVARIEWGLWTLVFMTYTRFSDVVVHGHNIPSIAQPFILLLIAAVVGRWAIYNEQPRGWMRTAVLVLIYATVALASLAFAEDTIGADLTLQDFAKDVVVAIVVTMALQNGNALKGTVWALLVAGIFMGTLSVVQQLTGRFDDTFAGFALAPVQNIVGASDAPRISGPIGDPNFYAQILVVLVPLAMERLWHARTLFPKVIAGWALAVSGLSILFTFSRGGFVGLAVVIAIMLFRHPPKLLPLLATLVLLVGVIPFIPPKYLDRLSTLTDVIPGTGGAPTTDVSIRGRLSENTVALRMFADHPLMGVGLGNYPEYYQAYSRQLGIDPRLEVRQPHSLYLEIASEMGALGLAAFVLLIWALFRGLQSAHTLFTAGGMDEYAAIAAAFGVGVIGYLTGALFLHSAFPRFFWLLFGIGMALPQVARNELVWSRELDSSARSPVEDGNGDGAHQETA